MRTIYAYRLNKEARLSIQTPEEGWRVQHLKCCDYNKHAALNKKVYNNIDT